MQIHRLLTAIDTQTEGGPTRIVTGGIPRLAGATMAEKMNDFQTRFDAVRRLLMLEPRGYAGMFGAVLTEPTRPEADVGVFFLTGSGYLNMCVHSAIGVAAAGLETGMIAKPDDRAVVLDTPAGPIALQPHYDGGELASISITTNSAYVHSLEETLDIGLKAPVTIAVAYSAVFFALADAKGLGVGVTRENIPELTALGVKILKAANEKLDVEHPHNPAARSIDLAMLYENTGEHSARVAVVSRSGSLARSPCGAGAGAKMALLHRQGKLGLLQSYVNRSVFETQFVGTCLEEVEVGPFRGITPRIDGTARITALSRFVVDQREMPAFA